MAVGTSGTRGNIGVQDSERQTSVCLSMRHDNYEFIVDGVRKRNTRRRRSDPCTCLRYYQGKLNQRAKYY